MERLGFSGALFLIDKGLHSRHLYLEIWDLTEHIEKKAASSVLALLRCSRTERSKRLGACWTGFLGHALQPIMPATSRQ